MQLQRLLASRAVKSGVYLFAVKDSSGVYCITCMRADEKKQLWLFEAQTLAELITAWQVYKAMRPDVIDILWDDCQDNGPYIVFSDYRLT